jgi:signal transduction histidine kinase/CheY-like chemotaxis protein
VSTIERLQKRLDREKIARKTAERLLEEKARELFIANQGLEKEVGVQSREAADANAKMEIAQTRLSEAMAVMPDRFAVFNKDQKLVLMNPAYAAPYKDTDLKLDIGTSRSDIIRTAHKLGNIDDNINDIDDWISSETLRWGRSEFIDTTVHTQSDQWIKTVERLMSTGDILTVRNDLTTEIDKQMRLDKALAQAEAANRAKSTFLANMSHEIRTPMNGVVGMAELLAETDLSSEQALFATTIKSSAEALTVIINDILDYSKIEAGQMDLFNEPFDLEQTLIDVLMILHPKASDKGLDLLIDYDLFLPSAYIGDVGRIRQILLNLIGNAIKFTETGSISITVVGIELSDGSYDLRLTVQDTGIGIPEDKLDHVFGSFKQVDEAENRKFEGTGLGLAITQQLVGIMGGEIWVSSEYGVGTCFGIQFCLPISPDAAPVPDQTPLCSGRVFVVDDTSANLAILDRQLSGLGLSVETHTSPNAALAAFKSDPNFDLFILDHKMPEMSAVRLAQALRIHDKSIPIFLTSSDMNKKLQSLPKGLFNTVLQKPMMREHLRLAIDSAFNHQGTRYIENVIDVTPAAKPKINTSTRPLKILFAEDNRTNRLVFTKMITGLNVDLTIVENGQEAIDSFKAEIPDAIITDISMPIVDGIKATQTIRQLEENGSHIPIYALTAHAMAGDKERFLEAGMDGYLTKPLKKANIVDTISILLAMRDNTV